MNRSKKFGFRESTALLALCMRSISLFVLFDPLVNGGLASCVLAVACAFASDSDD